MLGYSEPSFPLSLSEKVGGLQYGFENRSSSLPQNHRSLSNTFSTGTYPISQHSAQFSALGICPFFVSEEDIACVQQLVGLNSDFWKATRIEITALEKKKKLNQDKLLGLEFSTQDKNAVFTEQAKDLEEKNKSCAPKENADSFFQLR